MPEVKQSDFDSSNIFTSFVCVSHGWFMAVWAAVCIRCNVEMLFLSLNELSKSGRSHFSELKRILGVNGIKWNKSGISEVRDPSLATCKLSNFWLSGSSINGSVKIGVW